MIVHSFKRRDGAGVVKDYARVSIKDQVMVLSGVGKVHVRRLLDKVKIDGVTFNCAKLEHWDKLAAKMRSNAILWIDT